MSYTVSNLEFLWITVSSIIVLWDVAYVLLRPHTMPGGRIHEPIWVSHGIYGGVDHLYGREGYQDGDGLVAAYALVNLVESLLYLWCAWAIYRSGKPVQSRVILVLFAVSLTVATKTVLYGWSIQTPCKWPLIHIRQV